MTTRILRAEVIKGEIYINREDLIELIRNRGFDYLSSTALALAAELAEALEAGTSIVGAKDHEKEYEHRTGNRTGSSPGDGWIS